MSSTSAPDPSADSWVEDARALVLSPKAAWTGDRPLAARIAELLVEGEVATTWLRDRLIVAALARGDEHSPLALRAEEMAEREGVRGYLWLPKSLDADFDVDGLPRTGDDVAVVSDHGSGVNTHSVMQRQRWAGLRRGRATGVEFKRSTAKQYGWEEQDRYADRLVTDLDQFFGDEESVEQFVVDVVPYDMQHLRFKQASLVTESLRRRLRQVAAPLRRVPPYYPQHLTPVELAARREVTDASEQVVPSLKGDRYYARAAWPGPRFPALETLRGERRAVLLGDPGYGKSTIARAMVLEALAVTERAVSVFVSAAALARTLPDANEGWLFSLARMALSAPLIAEADDRDITQLVQLLRTEPHAYVVLDGIDEVLDAAQAQHLSDLIVALESLPGRLLLTSRQIGYRSREGWREVAVAPMREDFEQLIDDWYQGNDGEAARRAVQLYSENRSVHQLVEHPVLAGLVARLAADPTADLESGRADLYRQGVALLCARNWKAPHHPARTPAAEVALRAAYEDAAWCMAVGRSATPDPLSWTTVTTYADLYRASVDVETLRGGDLFSAYGTPTQLSEADRPWAWLHRSFADYFTARRLIVLWRTDRHTATRVLTEAIQYPNAWAEALAFFFELADFSTRRAALKVIWKLCKAGDPGFVILDTLEHVLDRDDPALKRFQRTFSPDDHAADDPDEEHDVHWREEFRTRHLGRLERSGLGHFGSTITDSSGKRDIAQARYLARTVPEVDRKLSAAVPELIMTVNSDRITPAGVPPLYFVIVTMDYPSDADAQARDGRMLDAIRKAWRVHRSGPADEQSSDLARAVASGDTERLQSLYASEAEAQHELAAQAIRGELGDWVAFNTGLVAGEEAVSADVAVAHARAGALLRKFIDRPAGRTIAIGTPSPATPTPASATQALEQLGDDDDITNIQRVVSLLEVLQQVGNAAQPEVARALVKLGRRLEPSPANGPMAKKPPSPFTFNTVDLKDQLWLAVQGCVARLPSDLVADTVLALYRAGEPVTAALIPRFTLRDANDEQKMRSVEVVRFALETGPALLDRIEPELSDPEVRLIVRLLDEFGARLLVDFEFFHGLAYELAEAGLLPKYREKLLKLSKGFVMQLSPERRLYAASAPKQ